jgi:site-specific DNA-methyltransferase (cytosine-N4-specific)
VVLDPFSGSGTTGLMAVRTGRRYIGIDVNRDYLKLSLRTRLLNPMTMAVEEAGGGQRVLDFTTGASLEPP